MPQDCNIYSNIHKYHYYDINKSTDTFKINFYFMLL